MDQMWGSVAQYHEIQWGWEIAIYLLLAGLSAGALISALLVKWSSRNDSSFDGLVKAGALLAPPAIVIGQGLLVADLGKPLSFWLLTVHFQFQSVMSIGVILLMVYSGLSVLFAGIVFKQTLADQEWADWFFDPLIVAVEWFEKAGVWVEWCMCLSATSIAAYTGFLLSALVAKPLLNVPLLPILFLVSGMSAGVAASVVIGITVFRDSVKDHNLKYLLSLDNKLIPTELFVLFIMFTGLFNMGGQYAIVAKQALTIGIWAKVFWLGVIGAGLVLPIVVTFTSLHRYEQGSSAKISMTPGMNTMNTVSEELPVGTILINSALVLMGVALLRFYILYAGQIFI
jgi:polysulfide reductase chain C